MIHSEPMGVGPLDVLRHTTTAPAMTDSTGNYRSSLCLDHSLLLLCWTWAAMRSKDPRTKVGAAVYDAATGAVHLGYNGFPVGVPDTASTWDCRDRSRHPNKYDLVVHAEVNALRKAWCAGFNAATATLYVTHWPCLACTRDVIVPSAIPRVVVGSAEPYDLQADALLSERHVEVVHVDLGLQYGKNEVEIPA